MKRPLLLLFLLTAAGIFFFYPRQYQPDPVFAQGLSYPVTVHGELYTYTQQSEALTLTLSNCQIAYQDQIYECRQLLVSADASAITLQAGNRLSVEGTLSSFQPARNPGNFDWRSYYLSRHISYRVYADRITVTNSRSAPLRQTILELRRYLSQCLQDLCPEDPDTAALLNALLLGDKTALEEDTKDKYEDGGILHILTVSGLHVSLLGTAALTLGKKLFLPPWLRSLWASLLVFLYWQLCGAGMSAGRAAVLFFCLAAAPLLKRSYDSLSALSLAGILILWDSPWMLFQAGFQLSFGAVLGIQLVCPAFASTSCDTSFSAKRLIDSLRFGLGLQLTLLPITLYHFFRYPLYSIFLNLLILPLTTPLFLLGTAAMLLAALSPFYGSLAADWLLLPCRWILDLYDLLCSVALQLPGASSLLGRPASLRIGLYYGLLILFCLWRYHMSAIRQKNTPGSSSPTSSASSRNNTAFPLSSRCHPRFHTLLSKLSLPLCTAALLMILLLPLPSQSLSVVFLDVGQGDCAFLETPTGTTLLIDCGSSDVKAVASYRLTPFLESRGIDHLDYVFLSHTDEDHVNGVTAWLEAGGSIGTVILPALPPSLSADDSYQKLLAYFHTHQIPVLSFQQGMVWQEGELTLTCLAPVSPASDDALLYSDRNMASQVLLAEYQGIRILFTGDCEKAGEQLLLSYLSAQQIDCHILKAGHHGSAYATNETLLQQLHPQAVIVSCGIRNRYGHPHPDMLARVSDQHASCHVTASCGAITVTIRDGNARIDTFLPEGELFYR